MEMTTTRGKPSPNYTGQKFGSLTIGRQYTGKNGRTCVDYKCDCGNEKIGAHLANVKHQKNCNKCQRRGVTKRPIGESAFNNLYNSYKQNARLRNHIFVLTKEEFKKLVDQNCYYCGAAPNRITHYKKANGQYIYNGVDRKNNSEGYTLDNSVSCCTFCNLTRNKTDFKTFIRWIRSVYEKTKDISL